MNELTTSNLANKIEGKLIGPDVIIQGIFTFLNHAKPGDAVIRHWIDENGVEIARNRGVSCVVTQNPHGDAVKRAEELDFSLIITPKIELANGFALRWSIENFAEKSIRVVVTGTNGKSTTAHMIQNILNKAGYNCYTNTDSKSEFNTLIDPVVSDQISRFETKTGKSINAMVIEVSEVQGWLDKLMVNHASLMTEAVQPDVLVLTNISMDHMGLVNSLEETYREVHGSLVAVEKSSKNSFVVLNYDDPLLRKMAENIGTNPRIISHGTVKPDFNPDLTVKIDGIYHGNELFLKMDELPFKSQHFLQNTMAAIGACLALNIDIKAIKAGVLSYSPLNRRFSILHNEPLIIDDFAHNPDGIIATIKSASKISRSMLHILFAIRGSRGELINRLNAEALATALKDVNYSLVITSSVEVVDHLNTVNASETEAVFNVLKKHAIKYTFKEKLEDAMNYTLTQTAHEDTVLLIGAQGMDPASEILRRILEPKTGLSNYKGMKGHMEYLGNYKDREVHFDAAFVPEELVNTLESFNNHDLIILIDNPDCNNSLDKVKVGEIIGKYAKVIICSGYNETTKKFDIRAANDVIKGAQKSSVEKLVTEDMFIAGELAIKHSNPGDIIVHVGPGAITNYEDLKFKMMSGIKKGCEKYD